MPDMRDMVESLDASVMPGHLSDIPVIDDCDDALQHGQRVVAGHATDVEDARLLLRMLGLVESPRPHYGRNELGDRSRAKHPTTND